MMRTRPLRSASRGREAGRQPVDPHHHPPADMSRSHPRGPLQPHCTGAQPQLPARLPQTHSTR